MSGQKNKCETCISCVIRTRVLRQAMSSAPPVKVYYCKEIKETINPIYKITECSSYYPLKGVDND